MIRRLSKAEMHKFSKIQGATSRCQKGDIDKFHNKTSHRLDVIVQNLVAMAT